MPAPVLARAVPQGQIALAVLEHLQNPLLLNGRGLTANAAADGSAPASNLVQRTSETLVRVVGIEPENILRKVVNFMWSL